jgi:hypothetical protein
MTMNTYPENITEAVLNIQTTTYNPTATAGDNSVLLKDVLRKD